MAEQTPLFLMFSKPNHKPKECAGLVTKKVAVLLIIWETLFSVYRRILTFMPIIFHFNLQINQYGLVSATSIFFPIGGMIADVRCGRYRVIIASVYICLISFLFGLISFLLWSLEYRLTVPVLTMLYAGFFLLLVGSGGFESNIIPFSIDQLMGSSSDQLSALIYWHMFGKYFARIFVILLCEITGIILPESMSSISYTYSKIGVMVSISGLSLMTVVVSNCIFKHWLDTKPHLANPIKLIFQVLNYARKNWYPRNRSALTYWENKYPSRLDLGKQRLGGPFSEEEVENVKTVFRMLPVFIPLIISPFAFDTINLTEYIYFNDKEFFKYMMANYCYPFIILLALVPLYQFIIQPFFYRYIPSMLNRISLGLLFTLITTLLYMTFVLINQQSYPTPDCPLKEINVNRSLLFPPGYKWLIIPHITCGISFFLILITSMEFIVAQSPEQMQGLMVGLWYACLGVGQILNHNFNRFFVSINSSSFGCFFFCYLSCSLIVAVGLIIFLAFTRYYKVRVRDYTVPIYQIAEEHAERYLQSERSSGSVPQS